MSPVARHSGGGIFRSCNKESNNVVSETDQEDLRRVVICEALSKF